MKFLRRRTADSSPDVTVILTIYNNEKYIEQAVRSLRKQSFRSFEVLCIEDCSTDRSYDRLQAAISGDPRFRIIRHEANKGVAAAWNTGIEQATGSYLVCLDGDDFIDRDAIRILYREITSGDFDIVACGFRICAETGKKIATKRFGNETVVLDHGSFRNYFGLIKSSFWGKIWRKSLFIDNDIRFPSGLYYQDLATTPRVLSFAKRIRIIENALYNYRQHPHSTTNSMSEKHIDDYFKVFGILKAHFTEMAQFDLIADEFEKMVSDNLKYHIDNIKNSSGENSPALNLYIENITTKQKNFYKEIK
ncbi:MAG: hypothetical protein CL534_09660 [Ahrensia sp.]|nr:hypothetical protein [Ahrensia sp.]